jgi:glyoxylase-like metal-dependent hydrolase (beta-lactamase superfamily II)
MTNNRFTVVNIGTLSMNKFWGESERKRSPSATCTLLDLDGLRVLVDPSPYPEQLEQRLFATTGLHVVHVDLVFVTHYHADHRFGLELFSHKPWLMAAAGLDEWRQTSPQHDPLMGDFAPAETHLPAGVRLLPTPGHTRSHHSLVMETAWGTVVVAGDAVMTADFFTAEEGFHNSVDHVQARETIRHIKQVANVVVPGHGNYFLNKPLASA